MALGPSPSALTGSHGFTLVPGGSGRAAGWLPWCRPTWMRAEQPGSQGTMSRARLAVSISVVMATAPHRRKYILSLSLCLPPSGPWCVGLSGTRPPGCSGPGAQTWGLVRLDGEQITLLPTSDCSVVPPSEADGDGRPGWCRRYACHRETPRVFTAHACGSPGTLCRCFDVVAAAPPSAGSGH